jgi:hypothetical protein
MTAGDQCKFWGDKPNPTHDPTICTFNMLFYGKDNPTQQEMQQIRASDTAQWEHEQKVAQWETLATTIFTVLAVFVALILFVRVFKSRNPVGT